MNPTFDELRLLIGSMPCVQVDSGQLEEMINEIEALRKAAGKLSKRNDYPPEFEEIWAAYPVERQGTKRAAYKAWHANINRGIEPAEIMLGLRKYLAHAKATGQETRYLKLAATFFGPDEHFAANYTIPVARQANLGRAGQSTADAARDFMEGR